MAEEEEEYSDDAEITPIVPSISKEVSTAPTPIITEVNDEKEEAEDDKKLKNLDTVDLPHSPSPTSISSSLLHESPTRPSDQPSEEKYELH
ncbi:hypothetical protein L6452_34992 [Arctium lappa]|uniref:Uncharacterized protein n=1 Tax=Arctium lappa TaxID=4217 RepID=A0ACB8YL93_ARCLA|nr:hypothetical protein L6452_34992 [Arctium lappa]